MYYGEDRQPDCMRAPEVVDAGPGERREARCCLRTSLAAAALIARVCPPQQTPNRPQWAPTSRSSPERKARLPLGKCCEACVGCITGRQKMGCCWGHENRGHNMGLFTVGLLSKESLRSIPQRWFWSVFGFQVFAGDLAL